VNQAAPAFKLPVLQGPPAVLTEKDLRGHVSLVNVWATWCYACAFEHDFLLEIATDKSFILYGMNYKDDPETAKRWLHEHGNPYQHVMVDATGDTAINWGVYGAPETFIVDAHGIVRHKWVGPLSPDIWEQEIKPLITQLRSEA
jgi:cytochrome c biogenesis protein CcmG/thiol:disulfide interchange protein DsbE